MEDTSRIQKSQKDIIEAIIRKPIQDFSKRDKACTNDQLHINMSEQTTNGLIENIPKIYFIF